VTFGDFAAALARFVARVTRWTARAVSGEVVKRVGGPARARVIVLLGAVLALNGADAAAVGAMAPQLETALKINNGDVGLLSSVSLLVGAIFTIPVGLLVDRVKRVPMLALSIVLWSLASMFSAFAKDYGSLLLTRLLLGAVIATAGPAIASLTGDYFPSRERGRVYAYILGGEIAGNAVGFIVCGSVASAITWRAGFLLLAIPGVYLARELYRTVPEPLRGGQSRLEWGVVDLKQAAREAAQRPALPVARDEGVDEQGDADLAQEAARRRGVEPAPERILRRDPRTLTPGLALRYIISIPTNVLMIISASLGYFFFAGLSTFALLFVKGHYHASQATAELVLGLLVAGALAGTLASGRLTDVMLQRGILGARVWVPAGCYLGAAVLLIPGFVATKLSTGLWFDIAGATLLSAANPPLNAAKLDIMPAGLWGRAESVRTVARSLAQALAPLVFGELSDLIAGIFPEQAPIGTHAGAITPGGARGLEISFLVLLVTLAAAGVFLIRARDTYPVDVATAGASHQGSEPPQ
jgi:sugar phosphate permease